MRDNYTSIETIIIVKVKYILNLEDTTVLFISGSVLPFIHTDLCFGILPLAGCQHSSKLLGTRLLHRYFIAFVYASWISEVTS